MDTIEIIPEPEAVITEDGYLFFRLPDGRYVDNPDNNDLVYDPWRKLSEPVTFCHLRRRQLI